MMERVFEEIKEGKHPHSKLISDETLVKIKSFETKRIEIVSTKKQEKKLVMRNLLSWLKKCNVKGGKSFESMEDIEMAR